MHLCQLPVGWWRITVHRWVFSRVTSGRFFLRTKRAEAVYAHNVRVSAQRQRCPLCFLAASCGSAVGGGRGTLSARRVSSSAGKCTYDRGNLPRAQLTVSPIQASRIKCRAQTLLEQRASSLFCSCFLRGQELL